MRYVSLLLLLLCKSVASAQQPAAIAVVKTWGELAEQPVITLKNGNKVRVGIEAREVTRNSAILVYALVEGSKWEKQSGKLLGPLRVVFYSDKSPEHIKVEPREAAVDEAGIKQLLFVNAIPIGKAGKYNLELRGPEEIVVAKIELLVVDKAPEPWLAFGHPNTLRGQELVRDGIVREINLDVTEGTIAMPVYDGHTPVIANFEGAKAIASKTKLPSLIFDKPDSRLKLQADLKTLRVESEMIMDLAYPRLHWLFRVWVNDKLHVPPGEKRQLWEMRRSVVNSGKELHLEWTLDPKKIGARKGDRISVQLLYCWDGWQIVSDSQQGWNFTPVGYLWRKERPRLPLLTNKAEFECP